MQCEQRKKDIAEWTDRLSKMILDIPIVILSLISEYLLYYPIQFHGGKYLIKRNRNLRPIEHDIAMRAYVRKLVFSQITPELTQVISYIDHRSIYVRLSQPLKLLPPRITVKFHLPAGLYAYRMGLVSRSNWPVKNDNCSASSISVDNTGSVCYRDFYRHYIGGGYDIVTFKPDLKTSRITIQLRNPYVFPANAFPYTSEHIADLENHYVFVHICGNGTSATIVNE